MNYTSFGFVSECIDQIKRQTSYMTTMVSDLLQMEGYLRYILIWLIIVLYSGKTRGDGKNWTIWRARYPCMYLMQNKHIKHHKCRKTKTYSTKSVKFNVGLCDDTIIGAKVVIAALPSYYYNILTVTLQGDIGIPGERGEAGPRGVAVSKPISKIPIVDSVLYFKQTGHVTH